MRWGVPRRVLALVPTVAAVLLALSPAPASADMAGDDLVSLEESLFEAGIDEPWVLADAGFGPYGDGVLLFVVVTSPSETPEEWHEEAEAAMEVAWDHARYRLLSVSVSARNGVAWNDGELPPTVSRGRQDMQRVLGDRDPALDARGLGDFAEYWGEAPPPPVVSGDEEADLAVDVDGALVAAGLLGLLIVAGGVTTVAVLASRRRRAGPPPTAYAVPDPWSVTGPWAAPPPARPPGEEGRMAP